jgi:hypothetical protein
MNLKRRMIFTAVGCAVGLTIAAALPASAASLPIEHFTGVQTSIDGPQTVFAAGPIAASGTDTQLGAHRDTFVFPAGTLTVRHEQQTETQKFDVRTCVGTFVETGTYVIQRGTGAYVHVTGSGHYRVTGVFQGCDKNAPPESAVIIIQAEGPISLG